MLDTLGLEALAASPSIQITFAFVLVTFGVKSYLSLPPRPKFPEAELDDRDWHGSLRRAKAKVGEDRGNCHILQYNSNLFLVPKQTLPFRNPTKKNYFTQLPLRRA